MEISRSESRVRDFIMFNIHDRSSSGRPKPDILGRHFMELRSSAPSPGDLPKQRDQVSFSFDRAIDSEIEDLKSKIENNSSWNPIQDRLRNPVEHRSQV